MSDDFIPLNQSTPVHNQNRWQGHNARYSGQHNRHNNRKQNSRRGGFNNRGNHSQWNSSYGSDNNSSIGREREQGIDAYLHPSMLQDPWANLRRRIQNTENQGS